MVKKLKKVTEFPICKNNGDEQVEILAPAGNIEQVIAAINAGCDAIYGGFKQWNARNRADNFSFEEYNHILNFCHKNSVKFYLTLNILFKDAEINEIIDLFKKDSFPLPDAVIATDIGFIVTLRTLFPSLTIHASTQFGAFTIEDLCFLEKIGVKRAILSRELSLKEIDTLCQNSNIETEVFVYGSQCLAFSGQCLWGGILHGCSGNRGRCIGMCRDFYYSTTNPHKIGQFLYPRDINAAICIEKIKETGVSSAKIEGRMRSSTEIAKTVRAMKFENDSNDGYIGYLSNCIPVNNMFSQINSRIKSRTENCDKLSYRDICIAYKDGQKYFCKGNNDLQNKEMQFVKCVYSNRLLYNKTNISLKLITFESCAQKIDYINTHGERTVFELHSVSKNSPSYTVDFIYNFISSKIKNNIYEFVSNSPSLELIHIDLDELMDVLDIINHNYLTIENKECKSLFSIKYDDYIETKSIYTIIDFQKKGFKNFIFDITGVSELKKALNRFQKDSNIIFKIPNIDFNNQVSHIFPLLSNKRIIISKISQAQFLENQNYAEVIANYSLNDFNIKTANFISSKGITGTIFHPELSYNQNLKISKECFNDMYMIVYGKFPIATTRACFSETYFCSHNCRGSFDAVNLSKGYSLKICCENDFGVRNILLNNTVGTNINTIESGLNRIVLVDYLDENVKNDLLNLRSVEFDIDLYRRSVN